MRSPLNTVYQWLDVAGRIPAIRAIARSGRAARTTRLDFMALREGLVRILRMPRELRAAVAPRDTEWCCAARDVLHSNLQDGRMRAHDHCERAVTADHRCVLGKPSATWADRLDIGDDDPGMGARNTPAKWTGVMDFLALRHLPTSKAATADSLPPCVHCRHPALCLRGSH